MRSATSWIRTWFLVVAALRPSVASAQSDAVARFRLLGVAGPTARLMQPKPENPSVFDSTLASAVGRVRVPAAVTSRPTATMQDLLGSGVTGVELTRAGGAIGFGGRTRIRGAASLLLSPDPLVYVNGIRVEGGSASQSQAFAGSGASPSRINDFDPEEIESIDVLKGPAAAALYGGDAANGVILITTKRGPRGGRRSRSEPRPAPTGSPIRRDGSRRTTTSAGTEESVSSTSSASTGTGAFRPCSRPGCRSAPPARSGAGPTVSATTSRPPRGATWATSTTTGAIATAAGPA